MPEEKIPEHWQDLDEDVRRVILRRARSDLWWEQAVDKMGRFKNIGVAVMSIILFLAWGKDILASALELMGFNRMPKP